MVIYNVKDRTELLSRVGKFEGETVEQIDIGLTYTWTNSQGVDDGHQHLNVGTGSWVAEAVGKVSDAKGSYGLKGEVQVSQGDRTWLWMSTALNTAKEVANFKITETQEGLKFTWDEILFCEYSLMLNDTVIIADAESGCMVTLDSAYVGNFHVIGNSTTSEITSPLVEATRTIVENSSEILSYKFDVQNT